MTEQQYEIYVQSIAEQARTHAALQWLMGWLAGYTYSGGQVDEADLEHAKEAAEEIYQVKLVGPFGPSETQGE